MKNLRLLFASLLAFAMIAAACSGSDSASGDDGDTSVTTAAEPEAIPTPTNESSDDDGGDDGEDEPVQEVRQGGTLVVANQTAASASLIGNTGSGTGIGYPSAQLFASPLLFDENYQPQPYLADSWSFADDGLSLTLNLNPDAVFHDGVPVKSSDVAFSIRMNQALHPFKPMFAPVESVDTPDDNTAVLNLSAPHPALLIAMSPALLPIVPEHVYGEAFEGASAEDNYASFRGFAGMTDPDVLVGSGPFSLTEFDASTGLVRMAAFEDFFLGRANVDEIVIQIIQDPNTTLVALEAEEVHIANLQGVADLERANGIDLLTVTPQGGEGIGAVVSMQYNLEDEVLQDKNVRKALAYAIDTDFIVNTLHAGLPFRAKSPIHPGSPFYDDSVEGYDLDLAKAGELLDAAGYEADGDGNRGLTLTMDYIPTAQDYQKNLAEYIKSALGEIGVEIEIRASPDFPTYLGYLAPRNYDLTMQILFMWADPVIGVHRSFQEANIVPVPFANNSAYINPEVEAILDEAGQTIDVAARTALYAEAQAALADDLPFYWIETLPTNTVYNTAKVQNPPLTIWGAMSPMHEVWIAE